MGTVDCREVEERLPWYVHGGLSAAERADAEAHLAACARCRLALDATREASRLFAAHPPVEALVDYALGLPVEGIARSALEAHLAFCEECREERQLVESEQQNSATAAKGVDVPPAARGWTLLPPRALALAAVLAAVSALSMWFAMHQRASLPQARVAVVELLPESLRTRAAGSDRVVLDRTRTTTLILITDRAETFAEVRVSALTQPGSSLLWREAGLLPAADGTYAVVLPPGVFAPGGVELVLEGRAATEWSEIGRYPVSLGP
jgi:hypothetical protein